LCSAFNNVRVQQYVYSCNILNWIQRIELLFAAAVNCDSVTAELIVLIFELQTENCIVLCSTINSDSGRAKVISCNVVIWIEKIVFLILCC